MEGWSVRVSTTYLQNKRQDVIQLPTVKHLGDYFKVTDFQASTSNLPQPKPWGYDTLEPVFFL